jgi:ATP-dependent exoDNAse (exonuclease V) alpha subunit
VQAGRQNDRCDARRKLLPKVGKERQIPAVLDGVRAQHGKWRIPLMRTDSTARRRSPPASRRFLVYYIRGQGAAWRRDRLEASIAGDGRQLDWQRQAAYNLAEGRFFDALAAYDAAGAITWTQDQDQARTALVEAWKCDAAAEPAAKRFVFTYTNRDVDALNAELRQVRRGRGELSGPEVEFETKHGLADFAVGDRVQFTDTDKKAGIYNGNAGTITAIDERTGQIRAVLDAPAAGKGREVSWSASEFSGFRHGYAGTIYKGQGKPLDHTYLSHTHHWRRTANYVALTPAAPISAGVYRAVARETARDVRELARQMARGEVKAAPIAWATREELMRRNGQN